MENRYYIRIEGQGRFINQNILECSEEELRNFFKDVPQENCVSWIIDLIQELKIMEQERS